MKQIAFNKQTKEKVRYNFYEEYHLYGSVIKPCYFVYSKGRSRYGCPYSEENFNKYFEIKPVKANEEEIKYYKSWKKLCNILEASGLWENLLERAKIFLNMPYKDYKQIIESSRADVVDENENNIYKACEGLPYNSPERDAVEQKFNRLRFGDLIERYPILFAKNYHLCLEEYEYGLPRIKTNNFGKNRTKKIRSEIKDAMENDRKYSTGRISCGYDVSLDYDPEKKKGWYSEEYHGYGNGHYFLMLDEKHVLFYEND